MQKRSRKFAVDIIRFCETLECKRASDIISYQLIKSATSIGANYRAACKSRSQKEFFSKICIVTEEVDESEYWLEIIEEADLSNNINDLCKLKKESNEITRIMTKAKNTFYKNN